MSAVTEEKQVEKVNIEVDGVPLEVPKNAMIIEATDKAGIDIPRFCYHRKLSIAANCRMCLVDVEKAPKPLPACATPVMEGMKVYTQSRRAIDAQHAVMEFLLINHPLDCPICDQGGECELQDLAMGYGRSVSRFTERKRVVKDKNVGPLIKTDMTRCIHCTRCVRFLEEIAGTSEMGGTGRADRMEITTCIERSIESELSGNVIDLCPVGALTDKPFRYSARAWEMVAHPSHGLHDGVGSALYYHTLRGRVMRAVPRSQEDANEVWLADRDRYSHFGLYAGDRVLTPRIKGDGEWREASWEEALGAVADALGSVSGDDIGVLMSPGVATEEYFLAQRLARGVGCPHIDHRLREVDFADGGAHPSRFQMPIGAIDHADAILLVGSNVRHEAPILGHRVRKAWRKGARVMAVNPLAWNFHFDLEQSIVAAPQRLPAELGALAAAVADHTGRKLPEALTAAAGDVQPGDGHRAMAAALAEAERGIVFVGQAAMSQLHAAWLRQLSGWIAEATGAALNLLPHGGNAAGAVAAGALPFAGPAGAEAEVGLDARRMLEDPRKLYLVWDFEPHFDTANPALAERALGGARVIAFAAFAGPQLEDVAHIILPLAPWPESEGSFINLSGKTMRFGPAGRPGGECRPGWKILRRLGHQLGLAGFDQVSLAEVQEELDEALAEFKGDSVRPAAELPAPQAAESLYRIGEVPMFSVDALCRRSDPLQETVHAQSGFIGLNPGDAASLGLAEGDMARAEQDGGTVQLPVRISPDVPAGAVWLRSATRETRRLGDAMGPLTVTAGEGD